MNRSILISTVLFFGASVSGGVGGESSLTDCNRSGYDIYMGWYAENTTLNPEDPTAGSLVACMPDANGAFKTQFLFSYFGCAGGVDFGTVGGRRIGDNLSGSWNGTVDGRDIGGSFSGRWNGSKFSGTWNNASGKVHIQIGSCEYFVAPEGTWELYPLGVSTKGLNIKVNTATSPVTISWSSSVSGLYGFAVSVLDKRCVYDRISIADCTMWSAICSSMIGSLVYGNVPFGCLELSPSKSLVSGRDYIISFIAVGSRQSDVRAFATKIFTAP